MLMGKLGTKQSLQIRKWWCISVSFLFWKLDCNYVKCYHLERLKEKYTKKGCNIFITCKSEITSG